MDESSSRKLCLKFSDFCIFFSSLILEAFLGHLQNENVYKTRQRDRRYKFFSLNVFERKKTQFRRTNFFAHISGSVARQVTTTTTATAAQHQQRQQQRKTENFLSSAVDTAAASPHPVLPSPGLPAFFAVPLSFPFFARLCNERNPRPSDQGTLAKSGNKETDRRGRIK